LLVDDVHWLDATSATLIAQLVDADLVFLVATVRAGEPVAPQVAALWHRGRVRRIDVEHLDRVRVDTLVHLVLRGPVAPGTSEAIWSASRGNVLFLRELVIGALDSGRLTERLGVWQLSGPLATSERLLEVVETRIGELDPSARDVLDALAVWEPMPLSILESVAGAPVLESLNRSSILMTRVDGRRNSVALAHPLYGEALRARMPMLTRRRLLIEHADRIEQFGARRREDPLRIATWRVDAAVPADGQLLLEAARLARWARDFPQVERLARAALLDGLAPECALLLGEALHELGGYDECEQLLASVDQTSVTDESLAAYIAEVRALNLTWGLHRYADARAVNAAALDRSTDADTKMQLALWNASLLTYAGQPKEALRALETIDRIEEPRARILRATAEVAALTATGKPLTALGIARTAFVEHQQLRTTIVVADPGLFIILQVYALAEGGMLREAMDLATAAYEMMPDRAPPGGPAWMTLLLGRNALFLGQPATARRWLADAVAHCDTHGFVGPGQVARSLLATAHALLGDYAGAAAAVAAIEDGTEIGYARPEQEVGRAWALVASGDVPAARVALMRAADMAANVGYRTTEAWLLHDMVRLGDATVAGRLNDIAADCEGSLVAAYAAHARAAAGTRPEPLVEATDEFEAIGAMLLAAETAAAAADAFQRQGDGRAAANVRSRAATLANACEGARTPALTMSTTAIVPLTKRERDIATLAVQGQTAKEIAEQLFLSPRTVNNHLQSVYTKLGISGRAELAAALRTTSV
jgi:DNA-binding CsgD family transcriptional regulator